MASTTSDADQEETVQEIATKIEQHKERLFCVRRCLKRDWVSDSDNFYAAKVFYFGNATMHLVYRVGLPEAPENASVSASTKAHW